MQVSVETTSSIERRMTIGVPSDNVEKEVEKRLQQTAKTARINGFRRGKVPMNVVKRRYGLEVRQEVLGEVMRNAYVEALQKEGINPVGYPRFEPKAVEEGKDLEFVAIVEIMPEVALGDFASLQIEKETAIIETQDVDNMLNVLRRQYAEQSAVERAAQNGDVVVADYVGSIDGVAFEGGSATGASIGLGSGQMIPGFEEGLVGVVAGQEIELSVTFPEAYHNTELAGKAAKFDVKVAQVKEQVLPELNKEFFAKFGIETESEEEFRAEIVKNMERELQQAISNKVKQQVVSGLVEAHEFAVPQSLIDQEIDRLRNDAVRQFGGMKQFKASDLPAEIFQSQAEQRVKVGVLFAEVVKQHEIKVDPARVDAKLQEIASTYQEPEQVVEWYKNNKEQMSQIHSVVMEEAVVDFIVEKANVSEKSVSYEEAVRPLANKPKKAE
ncbi:MAG: trigger factor [Hahellaceae bacterium]|nr:trigger factor [Hahellaceae bacterium]